MILLNQEKNTSVEIDPCGILQIITDNSLSERDYIKTCERFIKSILLEYFVDVYENKKRLYVDPREMTEVIETIEGYITLFEAKKRWC